MPTSPRGALHRHSADVYTARTPCRLLPGKSHSTMSVIRTGAGLLLYSPTPIDDSMHAQISALGDVVWLVAPNPFHNLYLADAAAAFPRARVFLARGVAKRSPACAALPDVADTPPALGDLTWHRLPLRGGAEELVLVSPGLKTAWFADGIFNVHHAAGPLGRLSFRAFGMYQKPVFSGVMRMMTADRAAARALFEAVAEAGVETLIPCHGEPVTEGAGELLRRIAASL